MQKNLSNVSTDIGLILFIILGIFFFVLNLIAYYKILAKAGYNSCLWMLVGIFVPFGSYILLLVFAFSEWPIEKELKSLKEKKN